jgi:type IV pilus assembly protein PilM
MPRLIAVDLGAHHVKVCTYRQSGRQFVFEERHAQHVPQDGAPPTLEQRLVALDALLDDVPTLRASGADRVVAALPAHVAAFHRIKMPFSDPAQIEKTLPFAVENEVPFELDDMVMGWRIAAVEGQTQILTALATHDTVSDWLEGLDERGLDPAMLYVDGDVYGPWASPSSDTNIADEITDVLEAPTDVLEGRPKAKLVAVVDVGHADTVVSVVRDGMVQYSRSINVAGWNFTQAIMAAKGCTWSEAEALKHGATLADEDITDPGMPRHSGYRSLDLASRQGVDAAIGLLLAELRSSLIKAEDTLDGEVVEVLLCGGSARIDELWDYIAQDLGVPVKPVRDPMGEGTPPSFALAQAMAGMAMEGAPHAIDLRVGKLAYRGGTDWLRQGLVLGFIGIASFVIVATPLTAIRWIDMHMEQSKAETMIEEMMAETLPDVRFDPDNMRKNAALMAAGSEDMVQRAEALGDAGGVPPTIQLVYDLTAAFPDPSEVAVEVKDLTVTRESVSFNAETQGYAGSAAVEEKLKATPRFANAVKGTETKQSNGTVRFPITIALGDADEEEG